MTTIQIVYWRDIPAHVKAKAGRARASHQLSERFQVAIDRAAMRAGLFNTDDYLNHWRTADLPADQTLKVSETFRVLPEHEGAELEAVIEAVAAELEAGYPDARLERIASNGGLE